MGVTCNMLTRTAKKLLGGVLFLVVLAGVSVGYRAISSAAGRRERAELLDQACGNLRELSNKPLPTCESELQGEEKALGGVYPRKLRCLAALSDLEGYESCSDVNHLESYPE